VVHLLCISTCRVQSRFSKRHVEGTVPELDNYHRDRLHFPCQSTGNSTSVKTNNGVNAACETLLQADTSRMRYARIPIKTTRLHSPPPSQTARAHAACVHPSVHQANFASPFSSPHLHRTAFLYTCPVLIWSPCRRTNKSNS
jgi:hypothetical protein